MDYTNTIYNATPAPQRAWITNNILPYYVDYNVTLYSRGHFLPLNTLFYTARFNGYCVHADGRETLLKQQYSSGKMSVNDITLCMVDQLGHQFQRNLPFGGQLLPGVPHIYPFLSGYDVDFITRVYELSNGQEKTTFHKGSEDWGELAADFVARCVGGKDGNSPFPWCGIGEIIYYNPKRKKYEDEISMYAGKTPLSPIPEYIQFSQENPKHPIIQIHYWIGDDNAFNDLIDWANKNPKANIILCHGGFERGDDVKDWLLKIRRLPKNVLVEISWTLLDMLYHNRDWIFDHLPCIRWVFGSDSTPHFISHGIDIDLNVDKLVQVGAMLTSPRFERPIEGNPIYPAYKIPNTGDRLPGEQKL